MVQHVITLHSIINRDNLVNITKKIIVYCMFIDKSMRLVLPIAIKVHTYK